MKKAGPRETQLRAAREARASVNERRTVASIRILPGRRPVNLDVVAQLAASMGMVGLLNPITISNDGVLIAGLHRLEAANLLGWTDIACNVMDLPQLDAELAEIDENLVRAELHYTDRGAVLSRRKEIYEARHPETKAGVAGGKARQGSASAEPAFADDVAAKTNGSARTVQEDVQVAHSFDPAEREVLKDHDIPKRDALRLARVEPELRKVAVAKIANGEASNAGDAIREVLRDRDVGRVTDVAALTGRYSCIVIDPPWDYSDVGDADVAGRSAPRYSRMPISEIHALPVAQHTQDDAHIYLWTTNRMLSLSFALLETWGFRYITMLTWCKPHFGLGSYFRNSTEHVLFGVRGSLPLLRKDCPTHFTAPSGEHSAKPDAFYELVRSCSPGPVLEMFSRQERDGFVAWPPIEDA